MRRLIADTIGGENPCPPGSGIGLADPRWAIPYSVARGLDDGNKGGGPRGPHQIRSITERNGGCVVDEGKAVSPSPLLRRRSERGSKTRTITVAGHGRGTASPSDSRGRECNAGGGFTCQRDGSVWTELVLSSITSRPWPAADGRRTDRNQREDPERTASQGRRPISSLRL